MRLNPFITTRRKRGLRAVMRAYARGAIAGVATGGTLAYLLDPDAGRRRRAALRDRTLHATHRARGFVTCASRDLVHRTRGLVAEEIGRLENPPVDDQTLQLRVRSRLGHISAHAHAIGVDARAGHVRLHGHVLAREAPRIVASARKVRGVTHVDNQLEAHSEAEHMPALEGGARRSVLTRWAPGPRMLAAAAGISLVALGARRNSLSAPLATTTGVALLVRSMTNRPLRESDTDSVLQHEIAYGFPPEEPKTGVVPRPAPG